MSSFTDLNTKVLTTPYDGNNGGLIKTSLTQTLNSGGSAVITISTSIVPSGHIPILVVDNTNNHAYTPVGRNNNGAWLFNVMKIKTVGSEYVWVPVFNEDCSVIVFYI